MRIRFNNSPTVRISGDEIFTWVEPLDIKLIRSMVIPWIKERGKFRNDYKNTDTGWCNICITPKGVKNSIQHGAGPEKIQCFAALPEMVKNGVLVKTHGGKSHQRDMIEHIFAAKVDINGKSMVVGFVIKEDSNGKRFYDHELTEKKNLDEVPSQVGAGEPEAHNAIRLRQGSIINILKKYLGVNK